MSPDFTTPSHPAFANDGPRRGVSSDFLAIHTGNAPATAFLTDPTTNDASQRRRFDDIQCMNCRLLVLNETDVRSIESRGNKKHLPAQRIHPDICAIPSHDPRPMMLRNLYGIDLGTSGLILKSQSREEILADKMIVLAFRENRVKNRDLRDIAWLVQQGVALPVHLISLKIQDHQRTKNEFTQLVEERLKALTADATPRNEFIAEMRRFSPAESCVAHSKTQPIGIFCIRRCWSRHRWPSTRSSEGRKKRLPVVLSVLACKALDLKACLKRFQRLRRRT